MLSRALAVVVFGSFLVEDCRQLQRLWRMREVAWLSQAVWQRIATKASSAAFVVLVLVLFVVRRPARRRSTGFWPRAVALAGAFVYPVWLQVLERWKLIAPSSDPRFTMAGTAMVVLGYVLAFAALAWLGRSFSIHPEARRLVTTGPYALVRHPLYVAETLAAAGMAVHFAARPAFAALAVQVALQVLRAQYEEEVLAAAFGEEFEAYRRRTNMFVPWIY